MATYKPLVITDVGKQLFSRSLVESKRIIFTRIQITDNDGFNPINLNEAEHRTSLPGEHVKSLDIETIEFNDEDGFLHIKSTITNEDRPDESFSVYAVGLYAKLDGDPNETLVGVTGPELRANAILVPSNGMAIRFVDGIKIDLKIKFISNTDFSKGIIIDDILSHNNDPNAHPNIPRPVTKPTLDLPDEIMPGATINFKAHSSESVFGSDSMKYKWIIMNKSLEKIESFDQIGDNYINWRVPDSLPVGTWVVFECYAIDKWQNRSLSVYKNVYIKSATGPTLKSIGVLKDGDSNGISLDEANSSEYIKESQSYSFSFTYTNNVENSTVESTLEVNQEFSSYPKEFIQIDKQDEGEYKITFHPIPENNSFIKAVFKLKLDSVQNGVIVASFETNFVVYVYKVESWGSVYEIDENEGTHAWDAHVYESNNEKIYVFSGRFLNNHTSRLQSGFIYRKQDNNDQSSEIFLTRIVDDNAVSTDMKSIYIMDHKLFYATDGIDTNTPGIVCGWFNFKGEFDIIYYENSDLKTVGNMIGIYPYVYAGALYTDDTLAFIRLKNDWSSKKIVAFSSYGVYNGNIFPFQPKIGINRNGDYPTITWMSNENNGHILLANSKEFTTFSHLIDVTISSTSNPHNITSYEINKTGDFGCFGLSQKDSKNRYIVIGTNEGKTAYSIDSDKDGFWVDCRIKEKYAYLLYQYSDKSGFEILKIDLNAKRVSTFKQFKPKNGSDNLEAKSLKFSNSDNLLVIAFSADVLDETSGSYKKHHGLYYIDITLMPDELQRTIVQGVISSDVTEYNMNETTDISINDQVNPDIQPDEIDIESSVYYSSNSFDYPTLKHEEF